ALIAQTTIPEESFLQISEAIKTFFPNLEVIQTICSAAKDRQDALRELIEEVDAVIIIGGRESANTGHLFAIAQESGKPCAFVESADEIPSVFKTYETVGLSAGASTPDSVIDEAERELLR
ncbi:MAG: 4-hydroxy-3-methylbut-2-enyl diphosphate reductase, partial [Treponema sp.]|nr:4-hydroxy-3-methylbut-2-enyl diphosphate reductase [Treponema sp.]